MTAPIRRQYLRIKRRYPEAIVFFRLGDFYETFDDDARLTARELEITLTSREMGKGLRVPMAGIPHHALDNYLGRLIAKGYKVALCEQTSDPKTSQGLVEREVVRVVTPGTVMEPGLLAAKTNNYLAAVVVRGEEAGLAHVDITTGEFATTQLPVTSLATELERLRPAELLYPKGEEPPGTEATLTPGEPAAFDPDLAAEALLSHFGAVSLEAYGCAGLPLATAAAGAILGYLQENQKGALSQISRLATYFPSRFMTLDAPTRRNLELFQGIRSGGVAGSLLEVLDRTRTAMGGRLLRRWLGQPLLDLAELERRGDAVDALYQSSSLCAPIAALLGQMSDLERLANRITGGSATPRELLALRRGLEVVPQLREVMGGVASLEWLLQSLRPCPEAAEVIAAAIADDPPPTLAIGGVIRPGFSPELDAIETSARQAKEFLASLESRERERTGIRSLKVGYNKVFGYYLEVTNPHLHLVPPDYIRKQTLVGAERFFTAELKEQETIILSAAERRAELEAALFRQVCQQVALSAGAILEAAQAVAHLDVFLGLAEVATSQGWIRPQLDEGDIIFVRGGRHPVVERALPPGGFVPNDTLLSNQDAQLIILTGPNMSGKSTYLRQVALVVLLAQIGSFVPAQEARLGLVDRIFTRVGAQDDLASGQSTFMVEMVETAHILHHATSRSLLIFDEIGRGTSTYDGMAIARAVVEFVHNHPSLGAKTLFATHYHELTALAQVLPRVRNYQVAVAEERGGVVFLHRIVPGGADRSYGIHVAQLAGLPRAVVQRATEILAELEGARPPDGRSPTRRRSAATGQQLSFFVPPSPVTEELLTLDVDSLTPLEAITKLYELKRKAEG